MFTNSTRMRVSREQKNEKMFKIKLIFQQFNLRKLLSPSWLTFLAAQSFSDRLKNIDDDIHQIKDCTMRKKIYFSHIRENH